MKYTEIFANNSYCSPPYMPAFLGRHFPTCIGYSTLLSTIIACSYKVRKLPEEKALPIILESISHIITGFEHIGMQFIIENMEYTKLHTPVIIVANHMSSLETIMLAVIAGGKYPVSFVSKRSVMSYPFFKYIFEKLRPVLIDRINPREDFKTVMREGSAVLEQGRNVVIFPQATRIMHCFPEDFSSIGVKLAKATGMPIVPLALKTNAWQVGSWHKDIGTMHPIPVRYTFFPPIHIASATGKEEHNLCISQICSTVEAWNAEEASNVM